MSTAFYDHRHHRLYIDDLDVTLDVRAFTGEESLSQPFKYVVEFTCTEQDIAPDQVLNKYADFSLHTAPHLLPKPYPGQRVSQIKPLRVLHGVITGFERLSDSKDEARYAITLQPRLALLDLGKQFRLYQHQSVPEIVKSILCDRHGFEHWECLFTLLRDYPRREQVMQFAESDLGFVSRLLAEVGIWYRVIPHDEVNAEVVHFHDDQSLYPKPWVELPCYPLSGMSSSGEDCVWNLQTRHAVVTHHVNVRAYDPRDSRAWLDAEIDQTLRESTNGDKTTYGEGYHYAEPYTVLGDRHAYDHELQCESGIFYARLGHERYLNEQTRLSGVTSCATLTPGQVLGVTEGAPKAFDPGAVITRLTLKADRKSSLLVDFDAIPYAEHICFRPPLIPKPPMAGTIPARITSNRENDLYSHIDLEGRYKVSFLFDRDEWQTGQESLWLRFARPYAGDTYGLHLPLICGTEVAVAFEQGDPDRPYIAHALHDDKHPDHVTLGKRDYTRNVLRTPANNKLRMEDLRGQEHVKLSTEHSGKSQLNLGHLVDAEKKARGEGFELRSDGWGAIRGGKGVFISADEQAKAQGHVLTMTPATSLIEGASAHMANWQTIAQAHHSREPALDGLHQLQTDAKDLHAPAILLSAPNGIGAVTPASLLLNSGKAMYLHSRDELNLAAEQRLSAHAKQAISLLAQQEGMRLVSGKGPLEIESHGDLLNLIAQQDITVQSVEGHLQLTAKNGITLASGGGYIRITPSGEIQIHGPGVVSVKGRHRVDGPEGETFALPELPSTVCKACLEAARRAMEPISRREKQA